MEMHSILMLVSILSIICFLTYFITTRQKRQQLRKNTEKHEPRFDLPTSMPVNHYDDDHQAEEFETESSSNTNLLFDDPLLQPRNTSVKKNLEPESTKTKSSAEEIVYLMLAAKPNKPYVGYELLQALLAAGLRFGPMNIFHRHEDTHGNGKILFSLAAASEIGTFEINTIGAFSGRGLMMFLRLSSNKDLMFAFETMLETARQLIEDLGGEILDDEKKILTNEKIEKFRKKILEFEQKQRIGDLFDQ